VHDWAGYGVWEERREELVREAEHRRLVKELREARDELPARGWRRIFALLGVMTVPFFGAFSASKGHN
jgi:hypothetical protein